MKPYRLMVCLNKSIAKCLSEWHMNVMTKKKCSTDLKYVLDSYQNSAIKLFEIFNALKKILSTTATKNRLRLKMVKNNLDISLFVLRFKYNKEEEGKKKTVQTGRFMYAVCVYFQTNRKIFLMRRNANNHLDR